MNYLPQIRASAILSNLNLELNQYFIVSAHREENVDIQVNFTNLFDTMQIIAERYDFPIIVSTHPRTRKRLEERAISIIDERIQFLKFLEFFEYVKLQMNARCVISDSRTITEESSILNFPAVTIRQIQERPEGMDEATLIMCGLKSKSVIEAIEVVIAQHVANPGEFRIVSDSDADNVSKKLSRIILSYVDYVNRTVWNKYDEMRILIISQYYWPEKFRINDIAVGLVERAVAIRSGGF